MRRHLLRLAVFGAAALAVSACAGSPATSKAVEASAVARTQPAKGKPGTYPQNLSGEISRARQLRTHGHYKQALRALAQLMLLSPDNPQVVGEYGKDLVELGRAKESLAFLDRAIELKPHDWSYFSARGVAQDQLHETKAAAQSYRAALAISPDQPSVLNNYALNQMMQGHKVQAKTLFEAALAHGGRDPRIAENLAQLNQPPVAATTAVPSAVKAAPSAPHPAASTPGSGPAAAPVSTRKATAMVVNKLPALAASGKPDQSTSATVKAVASKTQTAPPNVNATPYKIPALRTAEDNY
jgi:Flp pilus assembly protein TadD